MLFTSDIIYFKQRKRKKHTHNFTKKNIDILKWILEYIVSARRTPPQPQYYFFLHFKLLKIMENLPIGTI